jgi:hypothetical protein
LARQQLDVTAGALDVEGPSSVPIVGAEVDVDDPGARLGVGKNDAKT